MKKINKVVIPLAGLGTRMLPATKVISKEMLPLLNKPIIQYIVEEAIYAGFEEIIFVTRDNDSSAINHFETNLELESVLDKQKKKLLLKKIKKISKLKVNFFIAKQEKPRGLGHSILCAKSLIADQPFAVMLPDMILDSDYKKSNLALMKKNFEKSGKSSILLGKVKKSDVKNYGIVKLGKKIKKSAFFPLEDIVEKPTLKKAPSNLYVVGRYIFDNEVLNFIDQEKPDSSGEIQLTNAVSNYLKSSKPANGLILNGEVHDCGNKLGYLIANLAFSLKDTNTKKEVLKYLKKTSKKNI